MADKHPIPTNPQFQNLAGQKFGRWTVISFAGKSASKNHRWLCCCDCGTEQVVQAGCLNYGATKSCGCLRRELYTTHGMSKHPIFNAWRDMLARCATLSHKSFHNYGGRGIKVCPRWLNSFENFYADMGDRPSEKHSLDRINNDGNYEPGNCKWSTQREQTRNTRRNRRLTFRGKTQCVTAWAEELGVSITAIRDRLSRGWSDERALTP